MPIRTILLLLLATTIAAAAQTAPRDSQRLRSPYITSSGATVDKPGEPQGSAPTPLDRRLEQQDTRIDNSICGGCR